MKFADPNCQHCHGHGWFKPYVDPFNTRTCECEVRGMRAACLEMKQALEDLLDDMGNDGLCVCPAAKEQAIKALSRFKDKDNG